MRTKCALRVSSGAQQCLALRASLSEWLFPSALHAAVHIWLSTKTKIPMSATSHELRIQTSSSSVVHTRNIRMISCLKLGFDVKEIVWKAGQSIHLLVGPKSGGASPLVSQPTTQTTKTKEEKGNENRQGCRRLLIRKKRYIATSSPVTPHFCFGRELGLVAIQKIRTFTAVMATIYAQHDTVVVILREALRQFTQPSVHMHPHRMRAYIIISVFSSWKSLSLQSTRQWNAVEGTHAAVLTTDSVVVWTRGYVSIRKECATLVEKSRSTMDREVVCIATQID